MPRARSRTPLVAGAIAAAGVVAAAVFLAWPAQRVEETPRVDTKPADTKPADTKPADTKPADTKPADTKPADTKPADTKPADTKPADTKPPDVKPLKPKAPVNAAARAVLKRRLDAASARADGSSVPRAARLLLDGMKKRFIEAKSDEQVQRLARELDEWESQYGAP